MCGDAADMPGPTWHHPHQQGGQDGPPRQLAALNWAGPLSWPRVAAAAPVDRLKHPGTRAPRGVCCWVGVRGREVPPRRSEAGVWEGARTGREHRAVPRALGCHFLRVCGSHGGCTGLMWPEGEEGPEEGSEAPQGIPGFVGGETEESQDVGSGTQKTDGAFNRAGPRGTLSCNSSL